MRPPVDHHTYIPVLVQLQVPIVLLTSLSRQYPSPFVSRKANRLTKSECATIFICIFPNVIFSSFSLWLIQTSRCIFAYCTCLKLSNPVQICQIQIRNQHYLWCDEKSKQGWITQEDHCLFHSGAYNVAKSCVEVVLASMPNLTLWTGPPLHTNTPHHPSWI
jgi:hypothetical protein